jgi:hypothetical protein
MQTLIVDAALIPSEDAPLGEEKSSPIGHILNSLGTPHLKNWLQEAQEIKGTRLNEFALNTPLEEAIRMALDSHMETHPAANGLTGEAHALATQLLPKESEESPPQLGWALISLCHWHVNSGQVFMLDADPLEEQQSEALRAELSPFFAQVGISLFKHKPGVWLAQSELFHALPTASPLRVLGQEVEPWLVGNTFEFPNDKMGQSQSLKRLQSEVQMLLYHHPINQGRASALNSIWFSGTGTSSLSSEHLHWLSNPSVESIQEGLHSSPIWIDEHLREPYKRGDWRAWAQALESLDTQLFAQLKPGAFECLMLCGTQSTKVWLKSPSAGIKGFLSQLNARLFSRIHPSTIFHEN